MELLARERGRKAALINLPASLSGTPADSSFRSLVLCGRLGSTRRRWLALNKLPHFAAAFKRRSAARDCIAPKHEKSVAACAPAVLGETVARFHLAQRNAASRAVPENHARGPLRCVHSVLMILCPSCF